MPHTIAYLIIYRTRIDGLQELPKDKRPPRNLWDKPYKLQEFLDEVFETKDRKTTEYIEFDYEDVE